MQFIPLAPRSRAVPGVGRDTAKIAIVGDYTTPFDDRELKPFSGPNGSVLDSCLHAANIIRSEVYLTNVFKTKTSLPGKRANYDYFDETKKKFTDLGMQHVEVLRKELDLISANVIVAAGIPALMALTDYNSVAKYRGYVCGSTKLAKVRKIIPTYSPGSTIRGTYVNRHMIVADLKKAKAESAFPEIIRPERNLVYEFDTVEEVLEWLDYFAEQPVVCFDIEVTNYEVAAISFATKSTVGVSIPIGNSTYRPGGWTEQEELQIWRGIQKVLGNPKSVKIAQNAIFDTHFLLTKQGIVVRGGVHDTMVGHSVMFPELPKGLDFLGSIYCGSQEYWKDSVSFKSIKGDD